MNRKILMLVAAVVLAAVIGALWLSRAPAPGAPQPEVAQTGLAPVLAAPTPRRVAALPAVQLTDEDRAFVASLRDKFSRFISNRHSQIKLIEQVIAYLRERYPDDWQGRVQEFLKQMFPELAAQLYAEFEKLVGFNDWLRDHRQELMQLPPHERRQALWEARRAAFGDAAEEIWAGEIRNEKLIDSLARIDQAQGLSTDEKLSQFMSTVQETYGDDAQRFIDNSQTELLNRFVSVPSVQAQLGALNRDQQHAALRRMRTTMGLDDEALKRWDTLDASRDQAWDTGQSYQLQRSALQAQYSGDDLTRRLTALQDQMFGAEAETIRSEEAAGFFRFASTRRVGRE